MTDLSKCSGADCPLRENCHRYTSPADKLWQTVISPAYDVKRNFCWNKVSSKSVEKRLEAQRGGNG